jgi:hypothetical protein
MKELKCQHLNHKQKCYGENIYSKVGNEKRMALLDMVKLQGRSLKDAATSLNINYSTAKTILRVYRIENRILKKSPNQKKVERKCRIYTRPDLSSQGSEINYKKLPVDSKQNDSDSTTHLPEEPHKAPEDYLRQFKTLVSNLQVCISDVINNDNAIKKVCFMLQNVPNFNFQNFDLPPQAFPTNQFALLNYINSAPGNFPYQQFGVQK